LETAEPIHPASSPPRYCVGAAGAGRRFRPAGGPGEDRQHDHNGPAPRTTRGLSLGFIVRPSDPSARRGFVPMIRCLAAYISDAPRGGEREGAAARRPRATSASATARSRSEGCGRSSRDSSPLPPFASARMIRNWGTSRLPGRGASPWMPTPAGRVRDPAYLRHPLACRAPQAPKHRITPPSKRQRPADHRGRRSRSEFLNILLEQNDEWAVQRARYMTLETIAPMRDDLSLMLPAAAA
jgi:hypothetical protein